MQRTLAWLLISGLISSETILMLDLREAEL